MNQPRIDEHGQVDLRSLEALNRQELSEWLDERLHGFDRSIPSDARDGGMPHYLVSLIYPRLDRTTRVDIQYIMLDFLKDLTINSESPWRNEAGEELLMLTDPVLVQSNKREDSIDLLRQFADTPVSMDGVSMPLRLRVLQALVTLQYRADAEFWYGQAQMLSPSQLAVIMEGLGLIDISEVFEWLSQREWDISLKAVAFSVLPVLVEAYTAAKFISVLENLLPTMSPDCAAALREFCEDEGLSLTPPFQLTASPRTTKTSSTIKRTTRRGEGAARQELELRAAVVGMPLPSKATQTYDPWTEILGFLEQKLSRHSYDTWLKPTRFSHVVGNVIFVRVPSPEFRHLTDKFGDLIQEAIEILGLQYPDVKFVTAEEDPSLPPVRPDGGFAPVSATAPSSPNTVAKQQRFDWDSAAQLSPKYTFDAFVVGAGNQLAHAAAQAVAERPSKAYNPLFLYGDAGMGKTHLMQAIGHEVKRRMPQSSICYISSEKFTNELINSLRYDRMPSFRDKFRNVDVLLIDDIQFLAHKERMQEEFFHTFNALHESMKQIVIASDRPPKELAEIEDRLRSRFEWGLIADIQPPDLETKVAILQKKAELERVTLSTDLALYIASSVRTNVRELEGALIRLMAYCSLTGAEINLRTAQLVLKNFIDSQARKITIDAIQKAVAEQFGLRVTEIKAKSNSHAIVFPRQIAMFLSKQMTEASLPEIGRQFGGKHHSTVTHAIKKIEAERVSNKDLNRMLNKLTEIMEN